MTPSRAVPKPSARLIGREFEYRRVGYDSRPMSFLANGLVGRGAAACEVYWDIECADGEMLLRLFSDSALTCILREGADGVWRGQWLHFERMPIELVPLTGAQGADRQAPPHDPNRTDVGARAAEHSGPTAPCLRPDALGLCVLTTPRSPAYIHSTLASLFLSGPDVHRLHSIDLMIDSTDRKYLAEYQHHRVLRLHHLSETEDELLSRAERKARFCYTYWRCLSVPLDGLDGLIVLEDDVLCRHRFLDKLIQAVTEMESEHGLRRYILSLGANYRLQDDPALHRGRYFLSFPADWFYGTQAMYFPATVVAELRDWMWEEGVARGRREGPRASLLAGDLLIGQVGARHAFLYATARNLVDHIGAVSTGLGGCSRLPTFYEPWPERG